MTYIIDSFAIIGMLSFGFLIAFAILLAISSGIEQKNRTRPLPEPMPVTAPLSEEVY